MAFHTTLTALASLAPPPAALAAVTCPPAPVRRPPSAAAAASPFSLTKERRRRPPACRTLPDSDAAAPVDGLPPLPGATPTGAIMLPEKGSVDFDIFPGTERRAEQREGKRTGERGARSKPHQSHPPHPTHTTPGEFPPGTLLTGALARYRVDRLLGRGSNGTTYEATPLALNGGGEGAPPGGGGPTQPPLPPVALKAVSLRGAGGWKRIELFEREAATLAALDHPGIPAYREFFTLDTPSDRAFVLVQGLVVGGRTLADLVASGARGSPADVATLARQLLGVLAYLGSRAPPVTHRDVKPENIVLEGGGWGGPARLVDFGGVAAAAAGAAELTSAGSASSPSPSTAPLGTTIIGTFGYMAPEQFRGRAGPASDVYAAGGVLLLALTGRPPASFPQGRGLRLDLSGLEDAVGGSDGRAGGGEVMDALLDFVEGALEPEPEDRPSAAAAGAALAAAMGEGGQARGQSGARGGSAFPSAAAGTTGGRRRRAGASLAKAAPTTPARRPSATTAPPGARSILSRSGRALTIDVPPAPILAAERAGTAAFALMWNGTIALWTVSALAAGSLLAAAFSLPFWVAGVSVAKDALSGAMARERLELGPRRWTLQRERAAGPLGLRLRGQKRGQPALPAPAGSFSSDDADANASGRLEDCRGARVAITSVVNGVPRTRLELMDGFNAVAFGEALSAAEQRWLARVINAHLEEATGAPPDVPPDDEAPPPSVIITGPGVMGPPGGMGGLYGRGPFDDSPW